ncbi:MAG: hypothetical protein AVDCRST_MAG79-2642, partial [uncultured Thermoleophilia bacterium]
APAPTPPSVRLVPRGWRPRRRARPRGAARPSTEDRAGARGPGRVRHRAVLRSGSGGRRAGRAGHERTRPYARGGGPAVA